MKENKEYTTDAVAILYKRYYEGHPERLASLEEERANAEIARAIYDLRTGAGLTQEELAEKIGVTALVVERLEESDYEGHCLSMLRRVAAALGKRVELRIVPIEEKSPA